MTKMLFIIGAPRSGTTLLQEMLTVHPAIGSCPEPHLLTPLAHLGYFYNVEKAPYDHINAAEAERQFVANLPSGEADYIAACRAYSDTLYGAMAQKLGTPIFLDKTPAYALVHDFVTTIYPEAYYLVLTRHPLAIFYSYASSFFNGDYAAALAHNNILGRYVPAIAKLLRKPPTNMLHITYEELVQNPQEELQKITAWLNLAYQPAMLEYGRNKAATALNKGYGDPKVKKSRRPNTKSINSWAKALAADQNGLALAQKVVKELAPKDIALWGYNKEELFAPCAAAKGTKFRAKKHYFDSYECQRRIYLALKPLAQQKPLATILRRIRYYSDVLLRS